jgi:ABC-type nitrate/sulfonate/bicarbonate transport system substrate-binding protein
MSKRSRVLWLSCALVFLGACSIDEDAASRPLRVQIFTGAYSSIPVHVAEEKGFFAKHELVVERLPANSSSAALAAMIGGSMDVVESAADLVMANFDKGTDLRYLMSNEGRNYVNVVVGNHISIPDNERHYPGVVKHFAGKRIGVNAIGSSLYLASVLMLEEAGLDRDDVEFVATGTAATTMAAWRSNSVDVQVTFAPVPELLETLGYARPLFVMADEGPEELQFDGLYGGWVTTGDFLRAQPEKADRFIASIREAIDWIRDPKNSEEMILIAEKYAPVSALSEEENKAVLTAMIENYRRFWGYEISPDAIAMWSDYALRFDLIKNPVEYADIVYSGAPLCAEHPCQ